MRDVSWEVQKLCTKGCNCSAGHRSRIIRGGNGTKQQWHEGTGLTAQLSPNVRVGCTGVSSGLSRLRHQSVRCWYKPGIFCAPPVPPIASLGTLLFFYGAAKSDHWSACLSSLGVEAWVQAQTRIFFSSFFLSFALKYCIRSILHILFANDRGLSSFSLEVGHCV